MATRARRTREQLELRALHPRACHPEGLALAVLCVLMACRPASEVVVTDPWQRPVPGAEVISGTARVPAAGGTARVRVAEGASVTARATGFLEAAPVEIHDRRAAVVLWPEPSAPVVTVGAEAYVALPALPLDHVDPPGFDDAPDAPPAARAVLVSARDGFDVCPVRPYADEGWLVCGESAVDVAAEVLGEVRLVAVDALGPGAWAVVVPDGVHPFTVEGG